MKRKLLAIVLSVMVAVTMMPAMAFAAAGPDAENAAAREKKADKKAVGSGFYICGTQLDQGASGKLSDVLSSDDEGEYAVSNDGMTLTLINAKIDASDTVDRIFDFKGTGAPRFILQGQNTLISGSYRDLLRSMSTKAATPKAIESTAAALNLPNGATFETQDKLELVGHIYGGQDLSFEGNGTTTVKGVIYSKAGINVKAGMVSANVNASFEPYGVEAEGNITVTGGELKATGTETGVACKQSLNANIKTPVNGAARNLIGDYKAVYDSNGVLAKTVVLEKNIGEATAPQNLKATTKGTKSIKLSWGNVDNAQGYKIYQRVLKKKGKKGAKNTYEYKLLKTTASTSWTHSGLKRQTKYVYRVNAYNSKGTSGYSKTVSARTDSMTFKLKNTNGNNIRVTWSKVKGASGYQVASNDTKKGRMHTELTARKNASSYVSGGKKVKKSYKFKMRYYKMKNGKRVYSKWTSAKTIKVK